MKQKAKDILIVVFLGIFGVHRFMNKEYKMGFIYLFTFGLFGIGWIVDIIKVIVNGSIKVNKSLMVDEAIKAINEGKLPSIEGSNLNLLDDEICCYMDRAYTFEYETFTTGYVGSNRGLSIKLTENLAYNTGDRESRAIRKTQKITYKGILYITNRRIIYMSQKDSFDKTFDKITALQETKDGIIIQIGSKTYSIVIDTHVEFMKVFNLVKQLD